MYIIILRKKWLNVFVPTFTVSLEPLVFPHLPLSFDPGERLQSPGSLWFSHICHSVYMTFTWFFTLICNGKYFHIVKTISVTLRSISINLNITLISTFYLKCYVYAIPVFMFNCINFIFSDITMNLGMKLKHYNLHLVGVTKCLKVKGHLTWRATESQN